MSASVQQPDLFARAESVRDRERLRDDYPEGFWEWIEANDHIYRAFVALARRAKAQGFPRWASVAIVEHLRWETALRDGYSAAVKINNNARPGLARLAMAEHPDLAGFFCTREPPGRREALRMDGSHYYDSDTTAETGLGGER
jgi:hypothetical protein